MSSDNANCTGREYNLYFSTKEPPISVCKLLTEDLTIKVLALEMLLILHMMLELGCLKDPSIQTHYSREDI